MAAPVRPVPNAAALRLPGAADRPPSLVIADLHLGLGANAERPDGPPEGSARALAEGLVALAASERAGRVIVAGDVKHPIVGTPGWLRPVVFDFFSELLAAGLRVDVVLGNHDVGLVPHLPREVTVHGTDGARFGPVGVFHGHRRPSPAVLDAPTLVAGHLHPGFRFAPSPQHPDGKHRCWVRVQFPQPAPGRKRPAGTGRSRELVVLPAFHPLAGAESLNRQRPARGRTFLYGRFLAQGTARAYLLDGADLGPIATRSPGPARGRSRVLPAN